MRRFVPTKQNLILNLNIFLLMLVLRPFPDILAASNSTNMLKLFKRKHAMTDICYFICVILSKQSENTKFIYFNLIMCRKVFIRAQLAVAKPLLATFAGANIKSTVRYVQSNERYSALYFC